MIYSVKATTVVIGNFVKVDGYVIKTMLIIQNTQLYHNKYKNFITNVYLRVSNDTKRLNLE